MPIVYDNLGNPISYLGHNLTWEKGRQLKKFTKADGTVIQYTYNANGIRTSKTVDGVKHTYFLDGTKILTETWGDCTLIPLYDNEDSVCSIIYNDAAYYFHKNLQGDVIEIKNTYGVLVARYTYDAWGKVIAITDDDGFDVSDNAAHVANVNPFRYRGYYYDTETGLYYLQSRYYNPQWGQFLNADTATVIGDSSTISDKNMFAYCDNNPVMRSDDGGEFWHIVAGAAVGAVVGGLSSIISQAIAGEDINWTAAAISAASGAVSGAVNAAFPCMGALATGVIEGTISAASYAATETLAYGRDVSFGEVLQVGVTSGLVAGAGKAIAQSLGICNCFVAGTLVAVENGYVTIESIKAGDLVWATNPDTGETALKQVVQTFTNQTNELVHVSVNGETITCTNEHPFYSPVTGWIAACQLRAGDILVMLNGERVVVDQVQHELLESPVAVYNFEVEEFHTYYVGDTEVLVHNKCSKRAAKRAAKRSVGIPTNQKPDSIEDVFMLGQDGKYYTAKLEKYGNELIRHDWNGHIFDDGGTLPRHFNAGIIDDFGNLIQDHTHFWY